MFHKQEKTLKSAQVKPANNLTRVLTAKQLLAEDKRLSLLDKIRQYMALDEARFQALCQPLLETLATYCQSLPATANNYYSHSGGLLDNALNRTEAALSLLQDYLVQDTPNVYSEEQMLWQYALFSAGLLQGIGCLFLDFKIQLFDVKGQGLKEWNALIDQEMLKIASQYEYAFKDPGEASFRCRLNLLLAKMMMPLGGFDWIASDSTVLAVWLALLNEDSRSAGTLGALLIRADAIALARYFDAWKTTAMGQGGRSGRVGTFSGAPESLIDKEMLVGLEFIHWFRDSLDSGRIIINQPPLFMVPAGVLIPPDLFKRFILENPDYKNWQAVQKGFIALGLHASSDAAKGINRFQQIATQRMHSGVVFAKYGLGLPENLTVQNSVTGKNEKMSAMELIHHAQQGSQFIQKQTGSATGLQKLNAAGLWQAQDNTVAGQLAVKSRG